MVLGANMENLLFIKRQAHLWLMNLYVWSVLLHQGCINWIRKGSNKTIIYKYDDVIVICYLQGDSFHVECHYDSRGRTGPTFVSINKCSKKCLYYL